MFNKTKLNNKLKEDSATESENITKKPGDTVSIKPEELTKGQKWRNVTICPKVQN